MIFVIIYSLIFNDKGTTFFSKSMVSNFNRKLQARLSPEIHWIDSYSYLQGTGYTLTDGLHFSNGTYKNLYRYYLSALGRA